VILSSIDPFSPKAWGEFLNQNLFLIEHNLTLSDVEKALLNLNEVKYDKNIKLKQCPECEVGMQLLSVNHDLATQTGDDSKSVWLCPVCKYQEYSKKTVEENLNG